MIHHTKIQTTPLILAPAGNRHSFLAALAAGADAVYCGLKTFSARMAADNFTIEELSLLSNIAREKNVKIYVAMNSIVKPDEMTIAGRLIDQLMRLVKPDALIINDLAMATLAGQSGYPGELHLSTLANVSFPKALNILKKCPGISRVVVPRELSIDEIKAMAAECPKKIGLEVFVHGALCYGVSGRCYWSSFLGGKSGLRGRCVQPCRRYYSQKGQKRGFFSCQDFSLDVLAKTLLSIPQIRAWKIEGRKKGAHYVFNTVKAYRMFRDYPDDTAKKREALYLLDQSLGRKGTHYNFLSQRPQIPADTDAQTASGRLIGNVHGPRQRPYIVIRDGLFAGDLLRVGYEGEPWHGICRINRAIPKNGRYYLKVTTRRAPAGGTPVFLIDRREPELESFMSEMDAKINTMSKVKSYPSKFSVRLPDKIKSTGSFTDVEVSRHPAEESAGKMGKGCWVSPQLQQERLKKNVIRGYWWWLPPVIWPEDEESITQTIEWLKKSGGVKFVLNAPWQISFFSGEKDMEIWAGPFCNQANALSIDVLASLGFSGVIVSPELGAADIMLLPKQSPLPLGIIISGMWPLCISRTVSANIAKETIFISPMGEGAWIREYGSDIWVYPNWKIDLVKKKRELQRAGYHMAVHLDEFLPREMELKKRPGLWNWEHNLL